jgi:4-hydroxy 2-oxovalerate aldolase
VTRGYTAYYSVLTLDEAPAIGETVSVNYYKDVTLLSEADRINFFYNPTTGQLGNDLGQLLVGVDYGGVNVTGLGFGAGAGNTQLEVLLTVLNKQNGFKSSFDMNKIYTMSDNFESLLGKNNINYKNSFSHPANILSANYGLFSGFATQVDYFSKIYKLNKLESFKAIAKKNLVAGQEDLIMNIMFNLKKNLK